MRAKTIFKRVGLVLGILILVVILAVAGGVLYLRSDAGTAWLTGKINAALENVAQTTGMDIRMDSLGGPLPFRIHPTGIEIRDEKGVWLEIAEAELVLFPTALTGMKVEAETLVVRNARIRRLPVLPPKPEPDTPPLVYPYHLDTLDIAAKADVGRYFDLWPGALRGVEINDLRLEQLQLDPALLGNITDRPLVLDVTGSLAAGPDRVQTDLLVTGNPEGSGSPDGPAEHISLNAELARDGTVAVALEARENRDGLGVSLLPSQVAGLLFPLAPASGEGADSGQDVPPMSSLDGFIVGMDLSGTLPELKGSIRLSVREATSPDGIRLQAVSSGGREVTADIGLEADLDQVPSASLTLTARMPEAAPGAAVIIPPGTYGLLAAWDDVRGPLDASGRIRAEAGLEALGLPGDVPARLDTGFRTAALDSGLKVSLDELQAAAFGLSATTMEPQGLAVVLPRFLFEGEAVDVSALVEHIAAMGGLSLRAESWDGIPQPGAVRVRADNGSLLSVRLNRAPEKVSGGNGAASTGSPTPALEEGGPPELRLDWNLDNLLLSLPSPSEEAGGSGPVETDTRTLRLAHSTGSVTADDISAQSAAFDVEALLSGLEGLGMSVGEATLTGRGTVADLLALGSVDARLGLDVGNLAYVLPTGETGEGGEAHLDRLSVDVSSVMLRQEGAPALSPDVRVRAEGAQFRDFQLESAELTAAGLLILRNGSLFPGALRAHLVTGPLTGPDLGLLTMDATAHAEPGERMTLQARAMNVQAAGMELAAADLDATARLGGAMGMVPTGELEATLKSEPLTSLADSRNNAPDRGLGSLEAEVRVLPGRSAEASARTANFLWQDFGLRDLKADARVGLGGANGLTPAGDVLAEVSVVQARAAGLDIRVLDARAEGRLDGVVRLTASTGPISGEELSVERIDASGTADFSSSPPFTGGGFDPALDAHAETGPVRASDLALEEIRAEARGTLSGPLELKASTSGDVTTEAAIRWQPGTVFVDTLDIRARSERLAAAFGRTGGTEVMETGPGQSASPPPGDRIIGAVLEKPAQIVYGSGFSTPGLELDLLPSGTVAVEGGLSPSSINLHATASDVSLATFRPFVPQLPEGTARADIRLAGTPSRPGGEFSLGLTGVSVRGSLRPPLALALNGTIEPRSGRSGAALLNAALELDDVARSSLGVRQADARLSFPLLFSSSGMPAPDMDGPLSALVDWDGDLGALWSFVPMADRRVTGQAVLKADAQGTPAHPALALDATITEAAFEDVALGIMLTHINARAGMDENGLISLEASATDGLDGTLTAIASLHPDTLLLDARASMNRLKPSRRQDVRVSLSGQAQAAGPVISPDVTAAIVVNEGLVLLENLPGSGIRTLDVREAGTRPRETGEGGNGDTGSLNVTVAIPNRFFVRGYGLDSEWRGDIAVTGALTRPQVLGDVTSVRGMFDFLNRNFRLERGIITMDGGWPVNPRLDVSLDYQAANIVASLQATGTASRPNIQLVSQPSLPQDEILSQILFGESAARIGRMEAIQLAAATAQLAGLTQGTSGLTDYARNLLGVDVLRFNSGSDDSDSERASSSVEVGNYVSDKVYVGVQQGMDSGSTGVVVEVELTRSIRAQAKASGADTEASLKWQRNY